MIPILPHSGRATAPNRARVGPPSALVLRQRALHATTHVRSAQADRERKAQQGAKTVQSGESRIRMTGSRHLLSVRSALVLLPAVLTALGGAGLLAVAHR